MSNRAPLSKAPEKLLVSACLVGMHCRYDGCAAKDEARAAFSSLLAKLDCAPELVAFCPEEAGGLGTPRPPAWIESKGADAVLRGEDRVVTESGADVTAAFVRGAEAARHLAEERGITHAILKEHSPSCGVTSTSIGGTRSQGTGLTAQLLLDAGLSVSGA